MTTTILESGAIQAERVNGHRYRARLIEGDRWGSSGYYEREVLERDGPTVWPAGTPIYLDHPSLSEQRDRPERSVRDLAGKITTTPVYESDGLYADVEFYPHTAPVIEALWEDVGMSIRAAGTAESGTRDGRTGPVITSLTEGVSVDVVTRAGAGGKLVSMLEAARVSVTDLERVAKLGEALPGNLVSDDLRRRIEDALGPYRWIQDWTDEWVVYHDDGQLLQQTYTADADGRITLTGNPQPVARRVTYDALNLPSTSAGITTESRKGPAVAQIQIDEAEHKRLTETATRVAAIEAERDTAIKERDEARSEVTEAHKAADAATVDRLIAAAGVEFTALEAKGLRADLPTTEDGRLDASKFEASVKEAAGVKREASGEGRPSGVGPITESTDYTESDLDKVLGIQKGA